MKQKIMATLLALVMVLSLTACGEGEETTLTGMVASVDGTVISLMEMDGTMGEMNFESGEMPQMPEGMEDFEGFENFDPENFDPEAFEGTFPEDAEIPQWEDGEMPEGMTPPEDGEMPAFDSENGGRGPGFGNFDFEGETKDVDIGDAHISLETNGVKESGTLEDITPGSMVTITMNGKGEATYVLVSSQISFGGFA